MVGMHQFIHLLEAYGFQFLAIMNRAAMNIQAQVCVKLSFNFSGINAQETATA